MVGQSRRGRVRSEYEDLDEEMFNSWPSKNNTASNDEPMMLSVMSYAEKISVCFHLRAIYHSRFSLISVSEGGENV